MKDTFAANTFAANSFACGTWRGIGVDLGLRRFRVFGQVTPAGAEQAAVHPAKAQEGRVTPAGSEQGAIH